MENKIIKYTLFVGLNDKITKLQEISTVNAYKTIVNICKNNGLDGFTIGEATGFYVHDDGEIVTEKSLRIEILFATEKQVNNIINQVKIALNQESVVKQVEEVTSELV